MIEILYPQISNLSGDEGNILYLRKCFGQEVIETPVTDKPAFLTEEVDLVYLGSTSEHNIDLILEYLRPYKEEIKAKIEAGQHFLVTGNGIEVFANSIESNKGTINGLGIFDLNCKRIIKPRINSHFMANYKGYKIVGAKSQFSRYFSNETPFMNDLVFGCGDNPESKSEGIHYKNFYSTSLLGPFMILNPLFVKDLFTEIGQSNKQIIFDDLLKAYQVRVKELEEKQEVWKKENYFLY